MKPEPLPALFAGPFALATLSAPDGPRFPAPVTPDGQAPDLRAAFGDGRLTTLDVLSGWETARPRPRALAAGTGSARTAVAGLRVHAPVTPRQVFQSGANYRRHVIDPHVAHRAPGDDRPRNRAASATGTR